MGRAPRKNTDRQAEALRRLRELGGEAIRHGSFFVAGGLNVVDVGTMLRLADKGVVVIDTVGASTFARVAEAAPCGS